MNTNYKTATTEQEFKEGKDLFQKYSDTRLDTLANMVSAIKLYCSFEFYEIPPYRFDPIQGAVFMEKRLN